MKYEHLGLLHDMFRRQAALTPDSIAVVDGADSRQLTFGELDDITDAVSVNLQYRGVRPDTIVGIYMQRRLEYVIAYIAALKAGGAYMPIDPSYPKPLLDDIISDSKPVAILTEKDYHIYVTGCENVITCEGEWIAKIREENKQYSTKLALPADKPHLDSLAYTVYSSGTTGKPKGIQCPHRGAVFSYHWRHEAYPYGENEREACNVFFVWEMLRPMLKGVPCYIIPDTVIYDPHTLCDYIRDNHITRMLFTPSLLETVIDTVDVSEAFKSLRLLIFCGEVVTTTLLERCITALPHTQIINLYSVSEAHDISCSDLTLWAKEHPDYRDSKFCSVGALLPDVSVLIMDEALNPQPVGVSGEMYVATPCLARGYLNRPALNAERFINKPAHITSVYGTRLYKSGDWGYMMSDGTFEICGRCDSMVKIRGYSVEMQAIERQLLELPSVNSCVVDVVGEEGQDKRLVAYVVPEGGATRAHIRAQLKKLLPFYMIPTYFVMMSKIPLIKASGKLDKRALPAPCTDNDDAITQQELATYTHTQRTLVHTYTHILNLPYVDIHESFFDLGGHSLLATKLASAISDELSVRVSVRDVFMNPSVVSMAELIDVRLGDTQAPSPPPQQIDLLQEVERHDQKIHSLDIQLRAFWRSTQYSDRWSHSRVLLTGATGFLGAFILRDLILYTKTHIFCLVRETAENRVMDRIKSALVKYGIMSSDPETANQQQANIRQQLSSRVSPVVGDVSLVQLGMTSVDDYQYLSMELDVIIHTAAHVNLIFPYQMLQGPNVVGTQNIISFACTNKVKPLHYISTDAVFPHGLQDCAENADMQLYANDLTDGYAKSKWVAEQLVIRAMNRGLPAAIYRPGNLSGESSTGQWNPQDFTLLLIQGCLHMGASPQLDWTMDLTPVDFASRFIVTLVNHMALGLGKVYHLVNPKPIKSQWLFDWMNNHGYDTESLPYDQWLTKLEQLARDESVLGKSLSGLTENMASDASFFSSLSSYTQHNVTEVLSVLRDKLGDYPEISDNLLSAYFSNLSRRNIIPAPKITATSSLPLSSRVAIVTGASSGIGRAISIHLAQHGARVALVARRLDKLQDTLDTIRHHGGKAVCVQCDVTDSAQVSAMVRQTELCLGPVDILVNNAGVMYYTMMKNLNVQQWQQQIDVNCKSVVSCIGAVLDGMVQRKTGHIINMSSDAGRRGFAGLAVYSGTKFFIEGLSQGMRHELCGLGIKVTCIQPGDVKTELLTYTTDMEAKEAYDGSESGRILDADDIARAVVYACVQPAHVAVNELLIEPTHAPI